MAPMLEFCGGQQEPFVIDRSELYIGRGATCALRLDAEAAAERHARLTVDGAGNVFIQDLDTHTGTLRNGNFVYGVQPLAEGDTIEIGGMALLFRAQAPAIAVPPAAGRRAGADERTRLPMELPPEVRAVLAARQAAATSASTTAPEPPPPIEPAPAGEVVGTPEPEPENFRTVQMQPPDLAALGIDPASLPPITKPPARPQPQSQSPAPQAPAAMPAKRTILGMPAPPLPKPALAPTAAPPPDAAPPLQAPTPSAMGYSKTAQLQAQKLAAPAPTPAPQVAPQAPTMMAQAPAPAASLPAASPPRTQPTLLAQPMPVKSAPGPAMKTAPLMEAPVGPPVARPAAATTPRPPPAAYTPPRKGALGSFSRALAFIGQIFALAGQHKALFRPLLWDVVLTTPIMAAFTVLQLFVLSRGGFYAVMGIEAFLLYFVDYACNSITASLFYDYATTGDASMRTAVPRVKKALPGIFTFAAVSALFDLAATYARERNDIAARLVLRVLRAVWSTATYVIMPALVIEGVSFGAAFARSKQLMRHDPTGVGAGIVAMSITSYLVAAICFPLAYLLLRAGSAVHPAVGALLAMVIINLYWAVSGWMKIAYSTCFYLWARECERTGSQDHALAPLPLRTALDAA